MIHHPEQSLATLAQLFDTTASEMKGTCRKRPVATKRHFIAYFLHHELGFTKSGIARLLNRDHTSIIHSNRKAEELLHLDRQHLMNYAEVKDEFHLQAIQAFANRHNLTIIAE